MEKIGRFKIYWTVRRLAKEIQANHKDEEIVLIGVLKGAYQFMADLSRRFPDNTKVDFIGARSYDRIKSTGNVQLTLSPSVNVAGAVVILVEDIIDTGLTMKELKYMLLAKGAKKVEVCTLLNKQSGRTVNFDADYIGIEIGDDFVAGYGMDYMDYYRGNRRIRTLSQAEIDNGGPIKKRH